MRGPLLPRLWTERARKFWDIGRAVSYARANRQLVAQPHLLDVGARGGLAKKWEFAYRRGLIRASLVEPDPDEAQRLRARYPKANVIEAALGVGEGPRDLYLTHAAACSSLLPPDPTIVAKYLEPRDFDVDRVQSVQIEEARALIERGVLEAASYLKIDVQGTECEVLEGFGSYLTNVVAMELEVNFVPLYQGMKLFHELHHYLSEHGFGLVALKPLGLARDEIISANAYFIRRHAVGEIEDKRREFWRRLMGIPTGWQYSILCG